MASANLSPIHFPFAAPARPRVAGNGEKEAPLILKAAKWEKTEAAEKKQSHVRQAGKTLNYGRRKSADER